PLQPPPAPSPLSLHDALPISNGDVGHAAVDQALRAFAEDRPGAVFVPHLPQRRFWSCLAHARLLIGNSSAGLIEAASLGLPVVKDRKSTRLNSSHVKISYAVF